jgi:tetratricopeptide (TPR) repeat protein
MFVVLALTWFAYAPGLRGGFLFDDFANLPKLGETGPVDSASTLARYLTSGIADPTGRPVSLASFLLDANDWPAEPYPFKRTNLLIHLLNGLLLYRLLSLLGQRIAAREGAGTLSVRPGEAAFIGAGIWLLHPLFVSTTLYIVQREAMLPVTFSLLGLLGWLRGLRDIDAGHDRRGACIAIGSIVLGTLLGTMAKANGALLPVLVLAIRYTVLSAAIAGRAMPLTGSRGYRWLISACWAVFGIIVAGLLYVAWRGITHGVDHRPWTTVERLLTEPRILCNYLGSLWIPRPYTAGVFNDSVVVSTSPFSPWTTLPAIIALALLTAAAIRFRRVAPAASLAWLFFIVGHLLESTSIPLELYFEHRNYLSAMLLFWPLGLWLSGSGIRMKGTSPPAGVLFPSLPLRRVLTAIIMLGLAGMTWANATLWGDTDRQAATWARLNPSSPRAQVSAAQEEMNHGEPAAALARLTPLLAAHPEEVQLAFNVLAARCQSGGASPEDVRAAARSIAMTLDPGALIVGWYDRVLPTVMAGQCPGLDADGLITIASAGLGNPKLQNGRRQDLEYAIGAVRLAQRRPDDALGHFDRALAYDPLSQIALRQAAELGSAGFPSFGIRHLMTFDRLQRTKPPAPFGMPALHAWVLDHQHYWQKERARLEQALRADKDLAP